MVLAMGLRVDPVFVKNSGIRPGITPAKETPMASRRKQIQFYHLNDMVVMHLGCMDIWDGADLALIRDTLAQICSWDSHPRIGIDMSTVKHVPSGFFGTLFDWHERGVPIFFVRPLPQVRRMLWFRQFTVSGPDAVFALTTVPQEELTEQGVGHWEDDLASEPTWHEDANAHSGGRHLDCAMNGV